MYEESRAVALLRKYRKYDKLELFKVEWSLYKKGSENKLYLDNEVRFS